MYRIIMTTGALIGYTDEPRYVRFNRETSTWIRCNIENAQCIAYEGRRYSLIGRDEVEDAPIVALIQKVDDGNLHISSEKKIGTNTDDIDTLAWALNKMAEEIVDKFSFKTEAE